MEEMFPDTFKYVQNCVDKAISQGYLIIDENTNFRVWFEPVFRAKREQRQLTYEEAKEGGGQAANIPISGTQAIFLKHAMLNVDNYIKQEQLDCQMILTVHDELVIDCDNKYKNWLPQIFKQIMEETANSYFKEGIQISVDYHAEQHWLK